MNLCMKLIYSVFLVSFLFFLVSCNIVEDTFPQSGWIQQNSGTTRDLNDVFFVNADTGWCIGSNTLLETTDGGTNWESINIIEGDFLLSSIYFVNSNTGWISGSIRDEGSFILKTVNGGDFWITMNIEENVGGLFFINNQIGWGLGEQTQDIFATSDGGETWMKYSNCIDAMDLFFVNDSVGFSCLEGISKTTDGGRTWVRKQDDLPNGDFHGIFFINEETGWVTGCEVYKTEDSGETWEFQKKFGDYSDPPNSFENMPISCYFIDENIGWAAGFNGAVHRTTDGGNSWILQSSNTSNKLKSIFFINEDIGYTVGDSGTILKTTTGGETNAI